MEEFHPSPKKNIEAGSEVSTRQLTVAQEKGYAPVEGPELSEGEVFAQIESMDGIKQEDIKSIERVLNSRGVLVALNYALKPNAQSGDYREYNFILQGMHKPRLGGMVTTLIRAEYDADGMPNSNPVTIADYVDGVWVRKI